MHVCLLRIFDNPCYNLNVNTILCISIVAFKLAGRLTIFLILLSAVFLCAGVANSQEDQKTKDDTAKEYIYSIFAPENLSAEKRAAMRSTVVPGRMSPCPTMRIRWVVENWDSLEPETREELKPFVNPEAAGRGSSRVLPRMAELSGERTYSTQHFTFYFSTTDSQNAVDSTDTNPGNGVPDHVDMLANIFENVYDVEIGQMDLSPPLIPSGETKFPVYVLDMLGCGFTSELDYPGCISYTILGLTGTTEDDYPSASMIFIDRSYDIPFVYMTAEELAKSTIAHEFLHAIQFANNDNPPINTDLWYFEGTAVWMEDEVYDDINNYLMYLEGATCENWFSCTYLGIMHQDTYQLRPYGNSMFFKFLSQDRGKSDMISAVLDLAATKTDGKDMLEAYADEELDVTAAEMMRDLGVSVIEMENYRDGSLYDSSVGFFSGTLGEDTTVTTASLNDYSYRVTKYSFDLAEGEVVQVSSSMQSNAAAAVLGCSGQASGCQEIEMGSTFDGDNSGYQEIYAVIAMAQDGTTDSTISFDVKSKGQGISVDVAAGKWNLVLVPLEPFSLDPEHSIEGSGESNFLLEKTLDILHYSYLNDGGIEQYDTVWIHPDTSTIKFYKNPGSEAGDEAAFEMKAGEWSYLGTPSDTDPTNYDEDHVRIKVSSSVSYGLTYAVNNGYFGEVYRWDPDTEGYVKLVVGEDSLEPWTGYVTRPPADCTAIITHY